MLFVKSPKGVLVQYMKQTIMVPDMVSKYSLMLKISITKLLCNKPFLITLTSIK